MCPYDRYEPTTVEGVAAWHILTAFPGLWRRGEVVVSLDWAAATSMIPRDLSAWIVSELLAAGEMAAMKAADEKRREHGDDQSV